MRSTITPKTESGKINRIRLNMDRWRWLPRDLGERYIIVNVPAFTAALVENGVTRLEARRGGRGDQDADPAADGDGDGRGPQPLVGSAAEHREGGSRQAGLCRRSRSKTASSALAPAAGAAQRARADQVRDVQSANIYLHDTTAKSLFDTKMRAYSHGCIRTEHIMLLAERLLSEGAPVPGTPEAEGKTIWTPEKVQEMVASKKTVQANFPKPLPVYIVYMSSAALAGRVDQGLCRHLQEGRQGHCGAERRAEDSGREGQGQGRLALSERISAGRSTH